MAANPITFRPICLVAAALVPGLGHFLGGEKRRGVLAGVGIIGLFVGGLLIGGIDVIDSKEDFPWFLGQACVGPASFAIDHYHQGLKVYDPVLRQSRSAYPGEARGPDGQPIPGTPPNTKSVGRVNEIGTLYTTIAGMINLIAIIDAGFASRRPGAGTTR